VPNDREFFHREEAIHQQVKPTDRPSL